MTHRYKYQIGDVITLSIGLGYEKRQIIGFAQVEGVANNLYDAYVFYLLESPGNEHLINQVQIDDVAYTDTYAELN
jgi:hypothetical protein